MKWLRSWIATIAILFNRPLMKRIKKAEEEYKRGETVPWEDSLPKTYVLVHGVKHPLCIRCNKPVKEPSQINAGDKPTALIHCTSCRKS